MNEWKVVGLSSLVVNIVLVGLLFVAVFVVKGMIEDKNAEVTKLENEVALLNDKLVAQEQNVAAPAEEQQEQVTEEKQAEDKQAAQQPVKEAPKAQAAQPTDYKQKLASYNSALEGDFMEVYLMYEGWPSIDDMLGEVSNAELQADYEDAYKRSDAVLNKVYGILKENLPASEFKQLQAEQRIWLQRVTESKDQRLAMGGSSAGLDVAYELGYATQERCIELMMEYFNFKDPYAM